MPDEEPLAVVVHVDLGEDRVRSCANKLAHVAFNRLEGPMTQALGEAEDETERREIEGAIARTIGDAVAAEIRTRLTLLT